MLQLFRSSKNLADLLFGAAGLPAHVTFIEADTETGREKVTTLSDWSGLEDLETEGNIYGPQKAMALLKFGALTGISTTPIGDSEYRGGIRNNNIISAVSGFQNDGIDAMFSALFDFSLHQETRLHHVGFKFKSDIDRQLVMEEALRNTVALTCPASDHTRYYIGHNTDLSPNGRYWTEFQQWPIDLPRDGIHIDVATSNPEDLINFLGKYSGLHSEIWGREKDSPVGQVIGIEEGIDIAVMARTVWTDPITWQ
jgi:hypothetical protein